MFSAFRSNIHQGTTQTKKIANGGLVNGIFARHEDDKNRMKLENRNASFNYRVEEQEQEKRLSVESFGVPSSLGDSNHSLKSSFNGTGENHSPHYKPGPVKLSSNRCDSNVTNDTQTGTLQMLNLLISSYSSLLYSLPILALPTINL